MPLIWGKRKGVSAFAPQYSRGLNSQKRHSGTQASTWCSVRQKFRMWQNRRGRFPRKRPPAMSFLLEHSGRGLRPLGSQICGVFIRIRRIPETPTSTRAPCATEVPEAADAQGAISAKTSAPAASCVRQKLRGFCLYAPRCAVAYSQTKNLRRRKLRR